MTGPATTVPVTVLLAGAAAALTRPATATAPKGSQNKPRSRSSSWLAGASLVGGVAVGVIWLPMPWPALLVGACASCSPPELAPALELPAGSPLRLSRSSPPAPSGSKGCAASRQSLPAAAVSAVSAVSVTTPACSPGGSAARSCSAVGSAAPFFLVVLAASRAVGKAALPLCAGMRAAIMGLTGALLTMGTPVTEGLAGVLSLVPGQADRAI